MKVWSIVMRSTSVVLALACLVATSFAAGAQTNQVTPEYAEAVRQALRDVKNDPLFNTFDRQIRTGVISTGEQSTKVLMLYGATTPYGERIVTSGLSKIDRGLSPTRQELAYANVVLNWRATMGLAK